MSDSDDITNPTPSNEVLRAELKALSRELAAGFARIEARLDLLQSADQALEQRVREVERRLDRMDGAKSTLLAVAGALGGAIAMLAQWIAGLLGSKP